MMSDPIVELIHRGGVAPLTRLIHASPSQRGTFDGGIYYLDGSICKIGLQIKGSYDNKPKPDIDPLQFVSVPGCHIFGGLLQNEHFGHFLAESLTRLWAANFLSGEFNSFAFYLREKDRPIAKFVFDVLSHLIPRHRITVVSGPTRFDQLAVPTQIGDPNQGFIYGHPAVLPILTKLCEASSHGAERIYVSRSRLRGNEGSFLLENVLELNLQREGYEVLHPEEMSIGEQVAAYRAAKKLIFAEGSAVHLYALVALPEQDTFVVWRRKKHGTFDWQIRTFGAKPTSGLPSVRTLWVPSREPLVTVRGRAVLDFTALRDQLKDAAFIEGEHWVVPTQSDFDAELAAVGSKAGLDFVQYPQDLIGSNRLSDDH